GPSRCAVRSPSRSPKTVQRRSNFSRRRHRNEDEQARHHDPAEAQEPAVRPRQTVRLRRAARRQDPTREPRVGAWPREGGRPRLGDRTGARARMTTQLTKEQAREARGRLDLWRVVPTVPMIAVLLNDTELSRLHGDALDAMRVAEQEDGDYDL